MQVEVKSEVSEFLSVLRLGTCNVYSRGLAVFQQFYSAQGSIKDFLDRVERDRLLPRSQRTRIDRVTLNNFVAWLQNKGYSPKTISSKCQKLQLRSLNCFVELCEVMRFLFLYHLNFNVIERGWKIDLKK